MKRSSGRLGVGFVFLSVLAGACITEQEKDGAVAMSPLAPEAVTPDAREAKDVVLAVRGQLERAFGKANSQLPASGAVPGPLGHFDQIRAQAPANVELLSPTGQPSELPTARAEVVLPSRADAAFRLRDEGSGVSVDVGLVGATAASREDASGYVVYRSGYAQGAHIVHRPTAEGTEDYVYFPEKLPETSELRYEVALGEDVAGLRFVGKTLEMLDKEGAPRLRMNPPYAVDGSGRRVELEVAIEGCAYDDSWLLPWGRPTVDPGSRHCTVHLSWNGDLKAPLVVDPMWQLTGSMAVHRLNATASLLSNGKVVVVGGEPAPNSPTPFLSGEVFDPKTKTWTNTQNMFKNRTDHAAVAVGNEVYVFGGRTGLGSFTNSWEKYNNSTNSWTFPPALEQYMAIKRHRHTATPVPGKAGILLTGGSDGLTALASAEFFSIGSASCTSAGNMALPRVGHTATFIDGGKVLVVGGEGNGEGPNSAEIFNSNLADWNTAWDAAGLLVSGHVNHQAVKLTKKVVILGGSIPTMPPMLPAVSNAVDVFDIDTQTWATEAPHMLTARSMFGATTVPGTDAIVVMGGVGPNNNILGPLNSVEVLRPDAAGWETLPEMNVARSQFNAVGLTNGQILVAGGALGGGPGTLGSAELLMCTTDEDCAPNTYCAVDNTCKPRKPNGQTCDLAAGGADKCLQEGCRVCESGNCTDGVCCNSPCDGQCETCDGSSFGGPVGLCIAVIGQPVLNDMNDLLPKRDMCTGDGDCGGVCNGINRKECTYPKGNSCDTKCNTETNKFESLMCDGMGSCTAVAFAESCSPYVCGEDNKCQTTCDPNAVDPTLISCDSTSVCNKEGNCVLSPTQCKPNDNVMILPSGTEVDCGNFRCINTACLTSCKTAYDCATHADPKKSYVCNESSQCVEADFGETDEIDASCSMSSSSNSSRFGWMFALAAAAAVAARRNRARA